EASYGGHAAVLRRGREASRTEASAKAATTLVVIAAVDQPAAFATGDRAASLGISGTLLARPRPDCRYIRVDGDAIRRRSFWQCSFDRSGARSRRKLCECSATRRSSDGRARRCAGYARALVRIGPQ